MRKYRLLLFLFIISTQISFSQKITLLSQYKNTSFRGISIVNSQTAWISGTDGTIGKTLDGGKTWDWNIVTSFPKSDFRSIAAFSDKEAIIVAIDTPSVILKTKDGGTSWNIVWQDTTKGMFLDACYFDGNKGIVIGDPIDGKIITLETKDKGDHWKKINIFHTPNTDEAFFASSSSNVVFNKSIAPMLISSGQYAGLFYSGNYFPLPIRKGKIFTGANSIVLNKNKLSNILAITVGGDFMDKNNSDSNIVLIEKAFIKTPSTQYFKTSLHPPKGYKSSITQIGIHSFVVTGTSGTDISNDDGKNWSPISDEAFHVIQSSKDKKLVLLAGPNGKVAQLEYSNK